MRIEESDHFKIYLADGRDLVHALDQVDLVVTDPPYKLTSGGKTGGMRGGCLDTENYDNGGSIVECNIEWDEIAAINFHTLKSGKHAYVFCNNRHVQNLLNSHDQAGFGFHNLLVWDKRTATANRWYMKNLEYIGFFYKDFTFQINDCSSKQLISLYQDDVSGTFTENGTPHPTEKPVGLIKFYIQNSSKEGETVFDPFMGSGSTGVAAIESGRKFIGIEIDERFFNMAHDRLKLAKPHVQKDLF